MSIANLSGIGARCQTRARKIQIPDKLEVLVQKLHTKTQSEGTNKNRREHLNEVCLLASASTTAPPKKARKHIKQTEQEANHHTTTTSKQNVCEKSTRRSYIFSSQGECTFTIFFCNKHQFNEKAATQIHQAARTTISVQFFPCTQERRSTSAL